MYITTWPVPEFFSAYQPQLESLEQDLNRKIQDQLVWSDFDAGFDSRIIRDAVLDYDTSSDPGLILGLTTKRVYDSSNLPDLLKLSKVLDGLEKIVRDSLE